MALLQRHIYKRTIYYIEFPFLPERVNSVVTYLILFILPCWLINYLLIFRKKRYVKLLQKYPYYNGKLL